MRSKWQAVFQAHKKRTWSEEGRYDKPRQSRKVAKREAVGAYRRRKGEKEEREEERGERSIKKKKSKDEEEQGEKLMSAWNSTEPSHSRSPN